MSKAAKTLYRHSYKKYLRKANYLKTLSPSLSEDHHIAFLVDKVYVQETLPSME